MGTLNLQGTSKMFFYPLSIKKRLFSIKYIMFG